MDDSVEVRLRAFFAGQPIRCPARHGSAYSGAPDKFAAVHNDFLIDHAGYRD